MVMVNLQGKEISLNSKLKEKLDNIKFILSKDWDAVILLDGLERIGKSTLAITIASYLDPSFGINNIAIDTKDAVEKLEKLPDRSILLMDEGSLIFSSKDTMKKEQRKLIKILNVIGQKNMTMIIVLPSFFELNKWIATTRARFLIHCYHDEGLNRGRFVFFGTKKLKYLYEYGRKNFGSYSKPEGTFNGTFVKYEPRWYKEYLKVKQKTLISALKEGKENTGYVKASTQRDVVFKYLIENKILSRTKLKELLEEYNVGLSVDGISTNIYQLKKKKLSMSN